MVAANFFDHTGSAGDTMLSRDKAAGYVHSGLGYTIGENIAAGTGSLATPAQIVAGWMNSSGHRANILNPSFHDSGFGVHPAARAMTKSPRSPITIGVAVEQAGQLAVDPHRARARRAVSVAGSEP